MSTVRMRILALTIVALLVTPLLMSCGNSQPKTALKIALVTNVAGLHDNGFNQLAYAGLLRARKNMHIQLDVTESRKSNDYVANLNHYADKGYDLVIAVGSPMQTAVGTVAGKYPDTHFAIVDGYGTDASFKDLKRPNVAALLFNVQDAGALVGVIAGMLEKNRATPKKTQVISAVGSSSNSLVDPYIAGYKWGATHEDPGLKVLVGYSGNFADPTKCQAIAASQITDKSEIIFQAANGCGIGALQAAGKSKVLSIGSDTDEMAVNASVIASAVKRVDVATYDIVTSVVDGKFKGGVVYFGLKNDGVGISPGHIKLTADIQTEVDRIARQIKAGSIVLPTTIG